MKNNTGKPIRLSLFGSRTEFPAKGYKGGKDGGLRAFKINKETVNAKGVHTLEEGEEFIVQEAGGGGFGDPKLRNKDKIIEDYDNGFITIEGAKKDYDFEIKRDK